MEHVGMVYSLRVGHVSLPRSTVGEIATGPMGSWSLTVGSWHVVFSGEDGDRFFCWCRSVHSMFYLTWFFHIHIIIHLYQLYIYIYQFIYQSISFYIIYLCTWFLNCCCSTCSFAVLHLKHFGILPEPSPWAPASLWLRQVGKNYLTWPGGHRARVTMYGWGWAK